MTVTVASFRANFPAFADGTLYPNVVIDYWLALAVKMHDTMRWGNLLDNGIELFTAHNLFLERKAMAASENGSPPGEANGPVSGKSVDKVSVNYDAGMGGELNAGHWNYTTYGQRYIRLARMIGAGPVQVGVVITPDPLSSANAWSGPYTGPGFTTFM